LKCSKDLDSLLGSLLVANINSVVPQLIGRKVCLTILSKQAN